jgi:hypothetical protein
MIYILLDIETANQMASYRSEAEALADVRDTVERHGRAYVSEWTLLCKNHDGVVTAIAEGDALIDRAFGTIAAS